MGCVGAHGVFVLARCIYTHPRQLKTGMHAVSFCLFRSMNFSFKCHRRETDQGMQIFAVNTIDFHPKYGTFATGVRARTRKHFVSSIRILLVLLFLFFFLSFL